MKKDESKIKWNLFDLHGHEVYLINEFIISNVWDVTVVGTPSVGFDVMNIEYGSDGILNRSITDIDCVASHLQDRLIPLLEEKITEWIYNVEIDTDPDNYSIENDIENMLCDYLKSYDYELLDIEREANEKLKNKIVDVAGDHLENILQEILLRPETVADFDAPSDFEGEYDDYNGIYNCYRCSVYYESPVGLCVLSDDDLYIGKNCGSFKYADVTLEFLLRS